MNAPIVTEMESRVRCEDGLSALTDRFWIAVGKAAMALWLSHLLLKLDAIVPSMLHIGLWSLALSLMIAGISFVVWLQGLPHALDAVFTLFRIVREWRRRRADNDEAHPTGGVE
jgi:hypothetical protein